MRRQLFDDVHEDFRASFRTFLEREVLGHAGRFGEWEERRLVPREVLRRAGRGGFLGMAIPEQHGGAGVNDFRFNVVIGEEAERAGVGSFGQCLTVHNDMCLPYLLRCCNEEQRARWFPGLASGDLIAAIALTEPGAGSDLMAMGTTATPDNGRYLLNGAKTMISNGLNADLVIVGAKIPDGDGISLLVVERGMDGFARTSMEKIGQHAHDTAELSFIDTPVPVDNLLGEEGEGFKYLSLGLPLERLSIASSAVSAIEAALRDTIAYVRERQAFGQRIGTFQSTRFTLAALHGEAEIARAYVDRCVTALNSRELTIKDAAIAKWWCTELQGRVVDSCLQLHGGYGYMPETAIARAYVNARATRIYGGSSEIMKEIVGRSLGLS
ncbi:MAG TPA: acyl-CoA dehydrogenase family protein [Gaiellaceae bacterium]|nr:acyl-CoA dehydrogenase family protein [Gaiellaceae bacterium]